MILHICDYALFMHKAYYSAFDEIIEVKIESISVTQPLTVITPLALTYPLAVT